MSREEVTRSTRTAANAAALAVVAYAVLWFATTQVQAIREVSPFAEDPWDAVASYAAIFLPIVAGATWIRSLRHRGAILPVVTAARIRWGAGLAVAILLASVGVDLVAMATAKQTLGAPSDLRLVLIVLLVAVAGLVGAVALTLLVRTAIVARAAGIARALTPLNVPEPDIVDDFLALAVDVAGPIGLGRPAGRLSAAIERFLDGSAISPRRHRIIFGVVLAVTAAVGLDAWLGVVEGGWGSLVVPLMVGTLTAAGVLGIYLGTLRPLRLLRGVTRAPIRPQADAPE